MTATEPGGELCLIVGAARSGTTLVRLLIDAHPETAAPAEAGLPALVSHMAQVWSTINADDRTGTDGDPGERTRELPGREESGGEADTGGGRTSRHLPASAREWIRTTVFAATRSYCRRGSKRIYVDKSLDSVNYLDIVQEVFPSVRCVLVFRHVMDTIASGIEASPWGLNAYGYGAYVQAWPGNTVAALASYWADHVDRALKWEAEHPDACHRVQYEDLVQRPVEAISGIQRFLGVAEDVSVLHAAFARDGARGPGDYKVEHTRGVHSRSVGHGKRVPVTMLPPPLLEAVNDKLETLGYAALTRAWNAAERATARTADGFWSERLSGLMDGKGILPGSLSVSRFAVVADDNRALRWVVDPREGTIVRGDGEVADVLTGAAQDLAMLLTDAENVGVLLRSGRVRHVVPAEPGEQTRDVARQVAAMVAVLGVGSRTPCDGAPPGPTVDAPASGGTG